MSERGRAPIITVALIAANMAAAFALVWQPDLVSTLGYNPARPSVQAAVTSLFLHQNVLHLLGNMVFLAAVGAAVEMATGWLRFSVVYFVSGLVGVVAHQFLGMHPIEPPPLIGASGCIAGCAGYYTWRYVRLRVPLAPKFGVSILAVTLLWFGLQVVGGFVRIGDGGGGTAFWAHFGGFLAGLTLSIVFRAPDLAQIKLGHEVLEKMNARSPAATVVAARRHLELHPEDLKARRELVEALEKLGEETEEAKELRILLERLPDAESDAPIHRLHALKRLAELPSVRRLQLADFWREKDPELAACLLRTLAEVPDEPRRPEALLALAELAEPESEERRRYLTELAETYPLHPCSELARTRGLA